MKKTLTFLSLLLLCAVPLFATKYYVSPSGSDSNTGLSSSSAFQTLDKGINTASSYDTVYALAGTYNLLAALTITKPLALISLGASIDGGSWSASTTNKKLLLISNTSDVLVDGFVFKNLGSVKS